MIPPEQNARFVWRMEAVLDLYYEEPYDRSAATGGLFRRAEALPTPLGGGEEPFADESGPASARRFGVRAGKGMAHVLMVFEPLKGWREVEVSGRRIGGRSSP